MNRRSRIVPMPGQESVWDYPRPPRIEATAKHIRVVFNGVTIADTRRALRVLETSHPPVYYIPPDDVKMECLTITERHSFCEYKGVASYYAITVEDKTTADAVWCYAKPVEGYAALRAHIAFYASKVDACYVDDEQVQPEEGGFYGGWITRDVVGPF